VGEFDGCPVGDTVGVLEGGKVAPVWVGAAVTGDFVGALDGELVGSSVVGEVLGFADGDLVG